MRTAARPTPIANKLPYTQADWWAKRRATDALLEEIGGVVTRVGDETVGEMWSLFDGQDVLNEVDPQFSENIRNHVDKVLRNDPFHVSANTDPKGDRSKPPQEQDPDMLLHVVKETDAGIVVRGAEVRDGGGLCQPGLHQADDRQLGQRARCRTMPWASSAISTRRTSNSSAAPALPAARRRTTIRWPTASTKSMRWSSSTTC